MLLGWPYQEGIRHESAPTVASWFRPDAAKALESGSTNWLLSDHRNETNLLNNNNRQKVKVLEAKDAGIWTESQEK
jgi:hypothetical protein